MTDDTLHPAAFSPSTGAPRTPTTPGPVVPVAEPLRMRITATLPVDSVKQLLRVGSGSATRALTIALKLLEKSPEWQEMLASHTMHTTGRKWIELPTADPVPRAISRAVRDAMIYHECRARVFTRDTIAYRYGLSVPRIEQIYAKQKRNPPSMPTSEALKALQEMRIAVIDPLLNSNADIENATSEEWTRQYKEERDRAKTQALLNDWDIEE